MLGYMLKFINFGKLEKKILERYGSVLIRLYFRSTNN